MLNYFFSIINCKFIRGKSFSGGRNLLGRICVKGRGAGNKRCFRFVNFIQRLNVFGLLCKIIYDSRRTAPIVCVLYENGLSCYRLLIEDMSVGSLTYSGYNTLNFDNIDLGWSVPFFDMKLFSVVSCIEARPLIGSSLARSAGVCAILIGKSKEMAILKLNSGWILHVSLNCFSTYGRISKQIFNAHDFLKAGKMRAFGFKPKVRGVAKNPCDHPHGGGNGKKSKPCVPVNAWGRFDKWLPTKNTKKDRLKRRLFKHLV